MTLIEILFHLLGRNTAERERILADLGVNVELIDHIQGSFDKNGMFIDSEGKIFSFGAEG